MTTIFLSILAVLEFGSLAMLGWLAAAVLPWWIHHWHRRRYHTTPWAAVELLLAAVQQQARRVRFQQWLLLAVRTAVLVLVALAAAEPVLRQWARAANEGARTHQILVLDQSYSMSCRQQGLSRWQRALAQARRWIENCPDGDAFTIIGWTDSAENVIGRPTFDVSLALSAVEGLRLSQATAPLPTALRAVSAAIDRAEQEVPSLNQHHVVFFTDLGRTGWAAENTDADAWQKLSTALAKRASLTVLNVGDDQRDNVAVIHLTVDPAVVLRQQQVVLTATFRSFGKRDWPALTTTLTVDGRRVDKQQANFSEGGEAEVRFAYRFVDEGPHTVEVAIAGDSDGLPLDDRRWLVVDVRPRLRIACLAGQAGAADDVARALAPRKTLASPEQALPPEAMEPEVLPASRLGQLDLSHYDAVLLCNVAELSTREQALVAKYVRNGGGLAVLLGDAVIPDRYQYAWMPVRIGLPSVEGNYRFDPLEYRHPIVRPFRGRETAGLLGVVVARYFHLQQSDQHPRAEIALAFDTGEPALVVDRFGLGRVAVLALPGALAVRTSEGVPWSSFAVSPSFLPILRKTAAYLVGDRWLEQHNLLVGQPMACRGDPARPRAKLSVRLPNGERRTLPAQGAEDQGQLVFSDTDASGVYSLPAGDEPWARFAVNLDTRESDLTTVPRAALPVGFTTVGADPAAESRMETANFSFVRILLALALGLLLLEQLLAGQLGRRWG